MITLTNLWKRYHNQGPDRWILKNINLNIPKNINIGLIGNNGAGKSTLLRLIAGMDTPDKGEIKRYCSVSWPVGLTGGFQTSLTGRQNVKFVARIHGAEERIQEIISFVENFSDIGKAFDQPIKTYSSGMRSRLSFGLSLAFDFDIFLSDEATAVGDRAFKAKASAAFKNRIQNKGLIIVSHSEGILKELCQAGIWVDQGAAIWYDDINQALVDYHKKSDINKHSREEKC